MVNSNVLILFGFYVYDENGTYIDTSCWPKDGVPEAYWMNIWPQVHAWLYSYIPFALLAIANLMLLATICRKSRKSMVQSTPGSSRSSNKVKSVTITVLVVTLQFLFMTGVGTFVNLFMLSLVGSDVGYLIIVLSDSLCFSFHGLSIVTLILTNRRFRSELVCLLTFSKRDVRLAGRTVSGTKSFSLKPNIEL